MARTRSASPGRLGASRVVGTKERAAKHAWRPYKTATGGRGLGQNHPLFHVYKLIGVFPQRTSLVVACAETRGTLSLAPWLSEVAARLAECPSRWENTGRQAPIVEVHRCFVSGKRGGKNSTA